MMKNSKYQQAIKKQLMFLLDKEKFQEAFPDYKWEPPKGKFTRMPLNFISGRPYTGMNAFFMHMLTMLSPSPLPYYAGFKQIKKAGLKLQEGKGYPLMPVVVPILVGDKKNEEETSDEDSEESKQLVYITRYVVPVSYVQYDEQLHEMLMPYTKEHIPHINTPELVNTVCKAIKEKMNIEVHQTMVNNASIKISYGIIRMPTFGQLPDDRYWTTLFHELSHAIFREQFPKFDEEFSSWTKRQRHSFEEIVVEAASYFFCKSFCDETIVRDSFTYIHAYLQRLNKDKLVELDLMADYIIVILMKLSAFYEYFEGTPTDHTQDVSHGQEVGN